MASKRTKARPTSIDGYLGTIDEGQRGALERLRGLILKAAPQAEECITYGLPGFRVDGKILVCMGARSRHCALYPMSDSTIPALGAAVRRFETSAGTIRFDPAMPLPGTLVARVVKLRLAEQAALAEARGKKKAAKKKSPTARGGRASRKDADVGAFMAKLKHPRKRELGEVRAMALAIPGVTEGIKWNAPSFKTVDWFLTANVHAKESLRLILHTGARAKGVEMTVADPKGILKWLGKDRAMVEIADAADWKGKRAALKGVLRGWVKTL